MSKSGADPASGISFPLHDRSSPESGSPSAILLCRIRARSGCEQSQQDSSLFDHLVGDGKHSWRNCKAERFCGFQVDHQLELGRLDDWQITRLSALENTTYIDADLAKRV